MRTLWRDFAQDEAGVILSAELVIILTIVVLGMVVGLSNLQAGIIGEFNDLTMAFQSLNQSYATPSYFGCWKWWGRTSWFAGSLFIDYYDGCIGSTGMGYGGCEINGGTGCYQPALAAPVVNEVITVPNNSCPTGVPTLPAPSTSVAPLPVPSLTEPPSGSCPTCR